MKDFKKGVSYYTIAELKTEVGFPENEVICGWCPFVKHEYALNRHRCLVTDDMIYSLDNRPLTCPIVFEENDEGAK